MGILQSAGRPVYRFGLRVANSKVVHVKYCSQTVYETLLGCCRLWEATGQIMWRNRANDLAWLLLRTQQPDGGFDIGYWFNFGLWHRKGDSTSPELKALLALSEYGRLFGKEKVHDGAARATMWIKKFAIREKNSIVTIPYSPYTSGRVNVHNGVSFAAGALGYYLGVFEEKDTELHDLYAGMTRYLSDAMQSAPDQPGRYWYYCDQLNKLIGWQRGLIDYYHQMQQVEMHALAEQVMYCAQQKQLIQDAADHIAALCSRHPIPPYYNKILTDEVHLWGLSSVCSGFLEAAVVLPHREQVYKKHARHVAEWIVDNAWNGKYFEDVLRPDGTRINGRRYMVRSDAWVFNSLAAWTKHLGDIRFLPVLDQCYKTMERADFSSAETHAASLRKRLILTVFNSLRLVILSGGGKL